MIVARKVSFDAAHSLPYYLGKCANLHGHRWTVELAVEGEIAGDTGMVVDFSKIDQWMQENIMEVFDHRLMNEKLGNPTAETLALYLVAVFASNYYTISADIKLAWIKVWETPKSMVMIRG